MRLVACFLIVLAGASGAPLHREMLAAHNTLRLRLGLPPFAWSHRLAELAEDWAHRLIEQRQFFHRPKSGYGENLFAISGASASPAQVVDQWASESRNYDYRSNRCRGVCGHYTQLVWGSTKEIGCAVARGGGRELWVCNYDPPGNWVGRRPY